MRLFLFLLVFLIQIPAISFSSSDTPINWISQGLHDSLDHFLSDLKNPKKEISSRDISASALTLLEFNGDPKQAESLMKKLFKIQIMDQSSEDFGKIPWTYRGRKVRDDNSIEFCMLSSTPIYIHHKDQLSADFIAKTTPHLKAAIEAIKNHHVLVSYTNMFLMKSINLILLGQIVGDPTAVSLGSQQINEWLDYIKENGITEYDSPTYYGTDLDSLSTGYLFVDNDDIKANIKMALDNVWRDIAANYFHGRESFSGPHSRDYDFLNGSGMIDSWNFTMGIRKSVPNLKISLESICIFMSQELNGYRIDDKTLALANQNEKIILQRWGDQAGQDRYNYITDDFTIGSVSHDYCPYDKNIVIQLASSKKLPDISVVPDDLDQPYGKNKIRNADGHNKPRHLALNLLSVQDKGKLLVLLHIKPNHKHLTNNLATNILLPLKADHFLLNGQVLSLPDNGEILIPKGSVLTVQEGNAEVSLRVFSAQTCDGSDPRIVLKVDANGLKYETARLAIYHYSDQDSNVPDNCSARVGLLFDVESTSNTTDHGLSSILALQSAVISEDYKKNIWTVNASWGGTSLEASRDLKKKEILDRQVNGQPQTYDVFSVK